MKTTIQNLLVLPFIVVSLQTHAQGFVYDQQSATGPTSPFNDGVDGLYIQEDSPLLQSLIPTLTSIGFVQFEFQDAPNNGTNGATVYVNLWTGSPNTNSAIFVSSTMPVYMPNGFMNDGLFMAGVTNFYFPTPVTLIAGQTYYIQPVVQSGDNPWAIINIGNTYTNGQLFASGVGLNTDLWFREGVIAVPEPSTLELIGLSSLLAFYFKRRSKLLILSLFSASVLSVYSQSDSVVQATAENAGLASATTTALPRVGTYWVITVNANGNLTKMPYPMLTPDLSGLPIYEVTNGIFIVDDTGGHISSARMSRTQSAAVAQRQANDVSDLVSRIQTADDEELFQPNDFGFSFDTNGLWLEALNEDSNNVLLRLHNTIIGGNAKT